MPRYDGDRGRPGVWEQGGRGGWSPEYGGDFRPHPLHGRGGMQPQQPQAWEDEGEWESGPMYGPARYGLGPYHQRLRTRRRPDDEVRKEVEDALFYDTWVDAEAITVDVRDGVVTLKGELPDYHEIRYATDDAWDVDGVRGVHCELTVNGAKRPPVDGVPRRTEGSKAGNG